MSRWIIEHLPPVEANTVYVEPCAGMLTVLLRRPKARVELANDLNDRIVNWWEVVRDRGEKLRKKLELTPCSRTEFIRCAQGLDDMSVGRVERARRLTVVLHEGFRSADSPSALTHSSVNLYSDMNRSSVDYHTRPKRAYGCVTDKLIERVRDLRLENVNALVILESMCNLRHGIVYLDPPYYGAADIYVKGSNTFPYKEVAEIAELCNARVAISGYPTCPWGKLLPDWNIAEKSAFTTTNRNKPSPRTECLWMNY